MARQTNEVLIVPDWRGGNPYMGNLAGALEKIGQKIIYDDFDGGYFQLTRLALKHRSTGILHVHWLATFSGKLFWNRNWFKLYIRFFLLIIDMLMCRCTGIRIVWTVHNLLEHESPEPDIELKIRWLFSHFAHSVILHSVEAIQLVEREYGVDLSKKGNVIPLGHYLDNYQGSEEEKISLARELSIEETDTVILFFGEIRKYKGIETLLECFRAINNEQLRLIIAGKPFDEELRELVITYSVGDPRMRLLLEFVPSEKVANIFALANVVVLPFQRTLSSASVILAMGFGKVLILPEPARVLGIPGIEGALYYKDAADFRILIQNLQKIDLIAMGKNNLRVVKRLEWIEIAKNTIEIYRNAGQRIVWDPKFQYSDAIRDAHEK